MTASVLVLGLGNPLLGDEGLGLQALEALGSKLEGATLPRGLTLLDGGTAGLGLAPQVSAAHKVLVLDAIRAGDTPGTVLKLDGRKLARELFSTTSPHQMGLADVLSASWLAGGLGDVVVLGIEPKTTELGVGLSEPVAKALPGLVEQALVQLRAWGVEVEAIGCTK